MKKPVRILLVEDELIVAMDLQNRLESLGYEVIYVATSSHEAIEKALALQPDLVLMDIRLRGNGDGIDAALEIRQKANLPIVYLTALADERTLERAKMTEPFGYILKPFEERILYTTIEMALYKHKMESRILAQERWLYTILKSIGDAVIACDKEGRINFMNPVAEELTGWSFEECRGKIFEEVFQIYDNQQRKPLENPVQKVLSSRESVSIEYGTLLVDRWGKERQIADSATPLLNEKNELQGAVVVFRDVTEQKRIQLELQRAKKLESLGILASGIAHDFNNLLTAIIGNLYSIKNKAEKKDEIYETLLETEVCANKLKELTHQFITFSKGKSSSFKTLNLKKVIQKILDLSFSEFLDIIELNISDDLWPILGDSLQIEQVFQNILLNAVQALEEGERKVFIQGRNLSPEKITTPFPLINKPYVCISIKDTGKGIPREHLEKIFDPYFTTKKDGSGLGLAVAFAVVLKHNGLLTVESEVDQGTTFFVYLPANVS